MHEYIYKNKKKEEKKSVSNVKNKQLLKYQIIKIIII